MADHMSLLDMYNTTTMYTPTTNSTALPDNSPVYPEYVGFICAAVAVVFYGSNFVPVKKYETGDGMFFQWILCSAILLCGIVLQAIKQSEFYPICMLGGAIWATGNICVVPIIKTIGLGLGLCIWATTNLVAGWATGTFGLFDTQKATLANTAMNYAGVVIAGCSAFIYIFVKSEVSAQTTELVIEPPTDSETQRLINSTPMDGTLHSSYASSDVILTSSNRSHRKAAEDITFIDTLSPKGKFITGVILSLVSGVFYGNLFSPSLHVQHAYPHSSKDSLDYVFATFCGIYVTSTVYFLIYCGLMKNKPRIYPEAVLPGIVSGVMWAIATGCWFLANVALKSVAVTFPIVSTCPPIIASLFWGCVIFKEIKGFVPYIYKFSKEVEHLLPIHYKKRCYQFMKAEPLFVHVKYNDEKVTVRQHGRDMIKERVQNVPVKVIYPEESNLGLWGGEGIIVGLKKCKKRKHSNRVPKIWKPLLLKKPLYSEIMDTFYLVTVTMRTLELIDENFGFDNYILKTSEAELNSQLAMKFKREMLLELCNMADNPVQHEKMLKRYDKFLMHREEAEWVGLPSTEAVKKAVQEHEANTEVIPMKDIFMQQLLTSESDEDQSNEFELKGDDAWLKNITHSEKHIVP